jgi:hypothetical protein
MIGIWPSVLRFLHMITSWASFLRKKMFYILIVIFILLFTRRWVICDKLYVYGCLEISANDRNSFLFFFFSNNKSQTIISSILLVQYLTHFWCSSTCVLFENYILWSLSASNQSIGRPHTRTRVIVTPCYVIFVHLVRPFSSLT